MEFQCERSYVGLRDHRPQSGEKARDNNLPSAGYGALDIAGTFAVLAGV